MKIPFISFYLKRLSLLEEMKGLKNRVEELENQLEAVARIDNFENKKTVEGVQNTDTSESNKRLKLIQSIIKFRDQLLLFKENAEEERMAKLLTNLYSETGRILSINGVGVLNSGGEFLSDYHIAVEVVETEQKELVNKIESTFRDGYIVDGKMLRPQEVVVYAEKQ